MNPEVNKVSGYGFNCRGSIHCVVAVNTSICIVFVYYFRMLGYVKFPVTVRENVFLYIFWRQVDFIES